MAAQLMVRAMQLFENNSTFSKRLEFGKMAYYLLPRWLYYISVGTLVFVFFTQNLANILVTAQTMDNMIIAGAGKTCAIVLDTSAQEHFTCIGADGTDSSSDSPFGQATVFTLGYAVTLVLAIPLGIMNLDDNIGIQIGGMILTFVCVTVWVLNFCAMGLKSSLLPATAPDPSTGYLQLLPAILFNYGFVTTIPSWINEKRKDVRVGVTLWGAQALASVQYVLVAIFGGLAIDFSDGVDITARMNDPAQKGVWLASRIMTFVFPLANILTSIPVFSIIIRYNLLQLEGVKMPVWLANAVAVFLPWVVAVPFYSGNAVNTLITWSSALFFVLIQLGIPVAMYVSAEAMAAKGTPPAVEPWDDDCAGEEGEGHAGMAEDSEAAVSSSSVDGDEELSATLLATPTRAQGGKRGVAGKGQEGEGAPSSAGAAAASLMSMLSDPSALRVKFVSGGDSEGEGDLGIDSEVEEVHALPACCRRHAGVSEYGFGRLLLGCSAMVAITAFGLQVYSQYCPNCT